MALVQIYDHVLGTGSSHTIDFGTYLTALCAHFESLEGDRKPNVKLRCHAEPVTLDLDGLTTIGLVVSELIANGYAQTSSDDTRTISVTLSPGSSGGDATIIIGLDGGDIVGGGDGRQHGVELAERMMEQVGGSATFRSDHGAEWTLSFPVPTTTGDK
jgi:two-component sensor histidine kinase